VVAPPFHALISRSVATVGRESLQWIDAVQKPGFHSNARNASTATHATQALALATNAVLDLFVEMLCTQNSECIVAFLNMYK